MILVLVTGGVLLVLTHAQYIVGRDNVISKRVFVILALAIGGVLPVLIHARQIVGQDNVHQKQVTVEVADNQIKSCLIVNLVEDLIVRRAIQLLVFANNAKLVITAINVKDVRPIVRMDATTMELVWAGAPIPLTEEVNVVKLDLCAMGVHSWLQNYSTV